MIIKAIETHHAGHRFRSRLEARWAVFFDHIGTRWEYEPEGFECSARLTLSEESIPYLPDFWLPDFNMWGEVKGHLSEEALTRLLNVAASLSGNNGGGCHDNGGNDLVVFGNIPSHSENGGHVPTRLHMHKGDLQWSPWMTDGDGAFCSPYGKRIAADVGGDDIYEEARYGLTPEVITQTLLRGTWSNSVPVEMRNALQAARSARFEHGEKP
ncbi:hypothetical protein SAMN05216275_14138 [Streptosporangium canum]|uniref:Uncharacterized protein n=1 Tax=Streptosporangium canum TaxID=324952 RepID=A0A1I4DI18_9ACTN|nr:hypothetical protein [Streptosporangium canum]SFK92117.1 hypothetical protein SAMN05216275_14138 [Streptosporangium canum]